MHLAIHARLLALSYFKQRKISHHVQYHDMQHLSPPLVIDSLFSALPCFAFPIVATKVAVVAIVHLVRVRENARCL